MPEISMENSHKDFLELNVLNLVIGTSLVSFVAL